MKVLELTAPSEFAISEKPKPSPLAGEVLIKVACCGICGSDVHGMDNSSGRRIPPMIMGHEASGVIEELGESVEGWNSGDRVSFDSMVYCGKCGHCEKGETNLCEERQVMGVSCDEFKRDGAFAEWVIVPAHILESIPKGLSFEEAAFTEPLAVALHAVNIVKAQPGERALVVGTGLIGLLVVQALIAFGPMLTMLIGDLTVAPWHLVFGFLGPLWLLPNLIRFRGTIGAGQIRGAVMRGIMGIAVVNAAFAASVGQYILALIIVGLLVPGRFVGRWFYAT